MEDLQISRRRILKAAAAAGVLGALVPTVALADQDENDHDDDEHRRTKIRWDIISVDFSTGTVNPGGTASATAQNAAELTLTGAGTFMPNKPNEVTGGGTWTATGDSPEAGSGRYRVTRLISWVEAPGVYPPGLTGPTNIPGVGGDKTRARAGLAKLRVAYEDGNGQKSSGVLTVSCHLAGTSDSVFEGITASKQYVDFWHHVGPSAPPGDAGRTQFNVIDDRD